MSDTRLITGSHQQLKIRVLPWKSHISLAHCNANSFQVTAEIMWKHSAQTWDVLISPIQCDEPFPKTHLNCQTIPTLIFWHESALSSSFVPFFKMLPPSENYMSALLLVHRYHVHIHIFSQLLSLCAKLCCIPMPQNVGNIILYHQWTIHLVICLVWTNP